MRKQLEAIIEKYNLINQTFESFWINVDNYIKEDPEECAEIGLINKNQIKPELHGYSFCVTKEWNVDCIKVYIDIFLEGDSFRIGDYWCVYNLDGEFLDDYFVID
ncbi:MAG: hypothetical protein IJC04_07305 [Oscillospiraceae bacterium]|nr:hypothetical protein [Oscillospiraceae bacterium]